MKELRKISEGMTGYQASEVIYGNDRELGKAIDACRKELDANKAFVAQIEGESGLTISIEQSTGSGATSVMSQNAVTTELKELSDAIANTPKVAYSGDIETIGELKVVTNAATATKASIDGAGNSIAGQFADIYNKIDGEGGVTSAMSSMLSAIETLQGEVEELKKKSWGDLIN